MVRRVKRYLLVAAALAAYAVPHRAALAHKPRLVEGNATWASAYEIDDPETSWAFYADLETGGRVEYYRFELAAETALAPELLVPDEAPFEDFAPSFLLFGENVEGLDAAEGVELPGNAGAASAVAIEEDFFEAFTRKSYRRTARLAITLPAGTYGIAVYSPSGRTGEYVLGIGDAESFGLDDFPPMVEGCGPIFF